MSINASSNSQEPKLAAGAMPDGTVQSLNLDASGNLYTSPGAGVVLNANTEGAKATYSASVTNFVPFTAATDFWNLFGSASKTIRITRLEISGEATANTQVDLQLAKRSTAGMLGSAVLTAITATPHDSSNAAGTGTPNTVGTANYTTLGTLAGQLQARKLMLVNPAASTITAAPLVFDFTIRNEQAIVLRGVAQQIALNWNGAAVPAGTKLDINVTWTEE